MIVKALTLALRYGSTLVSFLFLKLISDLNDQDLLFYFLFIQPFVNVIPIIDYGNKNAMLAVSGDEKIVVPLLNNFLVAIIISIIFISLNGLNFNSSAFLVFIALQQLLYPFELRSTRFQYNQSPLKYNLTVFVVQLILSISLYFYFANSSGWNSLLLILLSVIWILLPPVLPVLFSHRSSDILFAFSFDLNRMRTGLLSSLLYVAGYFGVSYITVLMSNNHDELVSYSLIVKVVNVSTFLTLYYQLYIGKIELETSVFGGIFLNLVLLSFAQSILAIGAIVFLKSYFFNEIFYNDTILVLVGVYSFLLGFAGFINFFLLRSGKLKLFLQLDVVALVCVLIIRHLFEVNIYTAFVQMIVWELVVIILFYYIYFRLWWIKAK